MQPHYECITRSGNRPAAGATVTVRKQSDGTLATIYSDDGVTVQANPITAGSDGCFKFFAADGKYDVTVSGSGIVTKTYPVLLEDQVASFATIDAKATAAQADADAAQSAAAAADGKAVAAQATANAAAPSATLAATGGSALVGYIASGAGAVARTAQDKLRDVVSVKDFGAVGDGVTDDTAAIQAAIDSGAKIINGGGLTYAVNQINGRNNQRLEHFRLEKIGGAVDQVNALSYESFSEAAPITGVVIDDVHIDGNRGQETNIVAAAEDGGRSGFRFRGYADGVTIQNSTAKFCATDGLIVFASQPTALAVKNFKVIDCEFSDNRRHGISGDSLNGVQFVRVKAKRNGLTLNGQTSLTHGDHGDSMEGSGDLYGNGADIESYKGGDHSIDLAFVDCEMTGNARGGLLLLERDQWATAGYSAWRNVLIRGGKYDSGVDVSSDGNSITVSPNTATYTVGAAKFMRGLRIEDVDLVDGSVACRYADDVEVSALGHSGTAPASTILALCESVVYSHNVAPSETYIDQGAQVTYRSNRPGAALLTPGLTLSTGAGALTAVTATTLSESAIGAVYRIQAIYTPAVSGESARVYVSTVVNAQVLGCGLTSRTTGFAKGVASPNGRLANITVGDDQPVDVELSVLVY